MSTPRNQRLEWKPEPSFTFKWNNPLHLLAGFLFLTSMLGNTQVEAIEPLTKVYTLHCLQDDGYVLTSPHGTREQAIVALNRHLNGNLFRNINVTACSTSVMDVEPVTEEELQRIVRRP